MIPLVDLQAQYKEISDEIHVAIEEVLTSQSFILGKKVEEFEREFAKAHNATYCAGCSNGTSAITLGLKALNIGAGDEVITAVNTFIATSNAILMAGAKPVFVDCDKNTYLIDTALIEKAITPRTKAIIPVHLYGQMCDMVAIRAIANKHHLKIIEDTAQSHLATHKGQYPGYYGDIATFSFYPGKNLGAYGDAGAIITNTKEIYDKVCMLRNHGRAPEQKYEHQIIGSNERMDDLQAAVLLVKLRYLREWTTKRQNAALKYTQVLGNLVKTPTVGFGNEHVWHLYVIEVDKRDELLGALKKEGVGAGCHYPVPLHVQPCYKFLGYERGEFPVAEQAANRILSLPMYAEMSADQQQDVCAVLKRLLH